MLFKCIYENDNYIVVHKPTGLATQTARMGEKDLISEAKNYLVSKGKRPYVAVINRLDQPVEGLVLLAINEKTASELSRMLTEDKIMKYYKARVYGHLKEQTGILEDYIVKDGKTNTSGISNKNDGKAKRAVLEYEVESSDENTDYLNIHLITGRHHQIRVQFSHAGYPLVGDTKYGTEESISFGKSAGIAAVELKAYKLVLTPYNKTFSI